jgi:hypothetical protein
MATVVNLQKYFDERGRAVLAHEHRLRELGLIVLKTQVGTLQPVAYGGILSLYDLAFERRDEQFSPELIQFLETEINLSPEEIGQLEQRAIYRGTAA